MRCFSINLFGKLSDEQWAISLSWKKLKENILLRSAPFVNQYCSQRCNECKEHEHHKCINSKICHQEEHDEIEEIEKIRNLIMHANADGLRNCEQKLSRLVILLRRASKIALDITKTNELYLKKKARSLQMRQFAEKFYAQICDEIRFVPNE